MHDDLQTLRLLLVQAERQRDEALAEQLRIDAGCRAAVAQAEQLVLYRREYEQRWQGEFCREGKIELVRCYQGFMERLSLAVGQQEGIAANASARLAAATEATRGHDARAAGLKKLIERREKERGRVALGHEQRQHDEQAARAAWLRFAAEKAQRAAS
jgi:flagellar FliJ protein